MTEAFGSDLGKDDLAKHCSEDRPLSCQTQIHTHTNAIQKPEGKITEPINHSHRWVNGQEPLREHSRDKDTERHVADCDSAGPGSVRAAKGCSAPPGGPRGADEAWEVEDHRPPLLPQPREHRPFWHVLSLRPGLCAACPCSRLLQRGTHLHWFQSQGMGTLRMWRLILCMM